MAVREIMILISKERKTESQTLYCTVNRSNKKDSVTEKWTISEKITFKKFTFGFHWKRWKDFKYLRI